MRPVRKSLGDYSGLIEGVLVGYDLTLREANTRHRATLPEALRCQSCDTFSDAVQVQSDRELEAALVTLLSDPVRRARLGAAARALVESNRGARDRSLTAIAGVMPAERSGRGVVMPFRPAH